MGIQSRSLNLQANTLPRRCKSRLLPQGSTSVLYIYTYYIFPCFKLIRPRITLLFRDIPILMPETQTADPHNGHLMSQGAEKSHPLGENRTWAAGSKQSNTLPRRSKRRFLHQGSRSVLYTYTYYTTIEISPITKTFRFCKRIIIMVNLSCDTDNFIHVSLK